MTSPTFKTSLQQYLVMEVEKLLLHEFIIDNNVTKKEGGEATVSKAWHPRFGYNIFKIFEIVIPVK